SDPLFVVRGSGGPVEPLHEAPQASSSLGWPSASGERVLIELRPGSFDAPRVNTHRVVALSSLETLFEITTPADAPIADPKWQADARLSFVHAIGVIEGTHGWQTLYAGDVAAQALTPVYASTSNLREVRWTGWQP